MGAVNAVSAVPIAFVCAWCERTRTGVGRWEQTEKHDLGSTEATHGICPECLVEETRAASVGAECR